MVERSIRCWPLAIALVVLWSLTFVLFQQILGQNDGRFVYILDDPYIHMAIAKNITQHGVFGVDKYHFSSASSSLLWIGCLTLVYALVGVNEWAPFALNVACASGLLVAVYVVIAKRVTSPVFLLLVMLSIVFFTPLPLLIFTGLEHIAHIALIIMGVHSAATLLATPQPAPRWSRHHAWLMVLTTLATLTRYESMFFTLVVCSLLFLRAQRRYAVGLAIASVLPLAVFGLFSVHQGWYALPNSVLLKGNTLAKPTLASMLGFAGAATANFEVNYVVSLLVLLHLALFCWRFARQGTLWTYHTLALGIVAALAFVHMQFAAAGAFFRYEAYLIALGIVVLSTLAGEQLATLHTVRLHKRSAPLYLAVAYCVVLVYVPFAGRGTRAVEQTLQASTNIYQQQYQAARFVQEFYQHRAVAAIDIGALNFFADVQSLDLWGLADMEPARLKRSGQYDAAHLGELAQQHHTSIAIVYDNSYGMRGEIPTAWTKVGEWTIPNNVVCSSDTILFYAVDPAEAPALRQHLQTWSARLPTDVAQAGAYIQ